MNRRSTPWRVGTLAAVLLLACAAGWGCNKPLFSPREERSQFDRYDRSRNQYAPQFVEDEFGRQEPNLKGRLEPKDDVR
ncbi:MAG: hypothetical protein AAFX05_13370 [Planctomycetota bacterium]